MKLPQNDFCTVGSPHEVSVPPPPITDPRTRRHSRTFSIPLLVLCLLAAGLVTAATSANALQNQQTEWYINDDPSLLGPQESWYEGDAGQGYGANNYRWTYAIGGEGGIDNWAMWDMGERIGRQQVAVYIPGTKATATVTYIVIFDGIGQYSRKISQKLNAGRWINLGTWDFNGKDVEIVVYDNGAVQHWRTDGLENSRIGVDAMTMRCVANCATTTPTPDPTPEPTPTVQQLGRVTGLEYSRSDSRITWNPLNGATAYDVEWRQAGEDHIRRPVLCARADGTLFGSRCGLQITPVVSKDLQFRVRGKNNSGTNLGPWTSWETVRGVDEQPKPPQGRATGLTYHSGRINWQGLSDATAYDVEWRNAGERTTRQEVTCSSSCYLNITRARHLELRFRVRAKNSGGTGQWTGWTISPAEVTSPSSPLNLQVRATKAPDGGNRVVASWSPPSSNGGSPITGYTITFSRPGNSNVATRTLSASQRSLALIRAFDNTTYTVTVTATNAFGASTAAINTVTTPRPTGTVPSEPQNVRIRVVPQSDGTNSVIASWSPPSNNGGSPITGYKVTISRPGSNFGGPRNFSASTRTRTVNRAYDNTTYTIQVAARNAIGTGSEVTRSVTTPRPSGTVPSPPRSLQVRTAKLGDGRNRIVAAWSPPSYDGGSPITGYTITFSRPGNSNVATRNLPATQLHLGFNGALDNTTYTAIVTATNAIGTSAAITNTVTTRGPTSTPNEDSREIEDLTYTHGPYLEQGRFRVVNLRWDEVPGATSYEYRWNYPYPHIKGGSGDADASCTNNICAAEFWRNPDNQQVKIGVRAKIGTRFGPWSSWITIGSQCPSGGKYEHVDDRGANNKNVALKTFAWDFVDETKTVTSEIVIKEGSEGGQARHHNSLSQDGCSWVMKGSRIFDDAKVYENALLINNATAKDNARVYGNAIVNNATVSGDARVYGSAEIWGGAVIKGSADVSGTFKLKGGEISEGKFDGFEENLRALEDIYRALYREVFTHLKECPNNRNSSNVEVHAQVKVLIDLSGQKNTVDNKIEAARLQDCVNRDLIGRAMLAVIPGWTSYIPYGGSDAIALAQLTEIAQDLHTTERLLEAMRVLRKLYTEISKDVMCKRDCEIRLNTLLISNY